jgi:RsiW-degrading membrane proteinase PrsW (M82 family)
MDRKYVIWALMVLMWLSLLSTSVSAAGASIITNIICSVVSEIQSLLTAVGPSIVLIMFVYGGVKYIFSADDPGGRKQGKMICIHALIGGIILALALALFQVFTFAHTC